MTFSLVPLHHPGPLCEVPRHYFIPSSLFAFCVMVPLYRKEGRCQALFREFSRSGQNCYILYRLLDVLRLQLGHGAVRLHFREKKVDVVQEVLVAFGQKGAEAASGEWLVYEGRGQFFVQPDVFAGFHGFRDHDVGLAFADESGDFGVLLMDEQRRLGQVGAGEFLVRAAGVDHDADARLVEVGQGLEFGGVSLAAEDGLAEEQVPVGHGQRALAVKGAGDAAQGQVEFAVFRVLREGLPGRRDVFHFHVEGSGQFFR